MAKLALSLVLLCVVCSLPAEMKSARGPEGDVIPNALIPGNAIVYPHGFWFGKQNLLCAVGYELARRVETQIQRRRWRRSSLSRSSLEAAHRLFYFQGWVFEFGTGGDDYFWVGQLPANPACRASWEPMPAGNSTCSVEQAKQFTTDYIHNFGAYNLFTNNCHKFANRLAALLASPDCSIHATDWSNGARSFWRQLGQLGREGASLASFNITWPALPTPPPRPSWLDWLGGLTNLGQVEAEVRPEIRAAPQPHHQEEPAVH